MNRLKNFAAALTAFSVAATMAACSAPTIGEGSTMAMTIDNFEVKSGVFIFYTLTSYYDALNIVAEGETVQPTIEEVKDAHIDNLDATDWIQNKATDYCSSYVAVEKEFEKINAELTEEELANVELNVEQYASLEIYHDNGIGEETVRDILKNEYKRQYIFDYYYNFEGEWGMSEDELKDYFDENFARVKYVALSYLDVEGNEMDEAGKKEILAMADKYAEQINAKTDTMDKLFEVDAVQEEYNEYLEEQQAALNTDTEAEVTTTTTAIETEITTTTTTTDPYANEKLLQKNTTATTDESDIVVTTAAESASTNTLDKLNDYVFGDLITNTAKVLNDKENDTVYVVIRADLRERMTEDGYWSEDYISALQSLKFSDEFTEYIETLAKSYSTDRNKSAYRRYSPFKLILETESQ